MVARGRLIPVPNLDDRDWQAIRDAMVAEIPSRCPEWTDLNISDPGVTFIEVFAVSIEELLYRLNQVLPKHLREYLNMIGVTLTPASVANILPPEILHNEETLLPMRPSFFVSALIFAAPR